MLSAPRSGEKSGATIPPNTTGAPLPPPARNKRLRRGARQRVAEAEAEARPQAERDPTRSSRLARLAIMRQTRPRTSTSLPSSDRPQVTARDIELMCLPGDRVSQALVVENGVETPQDRGGSLRIASISPRLAKALILSVQFVWLCVATIWILAHKNDAPSVLDCERTGSFHPAVCLVLLGFFLSATLFRPIDAKLVNSMQHRSLFSKLSVLLACIFAIVSASIGYPQGLCDSECKCGFCVPDLADTNATALLAVSGDPNESSSGNCSAREAGDATYDATSCSNAAVNKLSTAAVCAVPKFSTVVLSPIFSQQEEEHTNDLALTLDNLELALRMQRSRESGDELTNFNLTYFPADGTCAEPQDYFCDEKEMLKNFILRGLIPAVCDSVYFFCNADNLPRSPCGDTVCCNMCRLVGDLHHCLTLEDNETASKFHRAVYSTNYEIEKLLNDGYKNYINFIPREALSRMVLAANWSLHTVLSLALDQDTLGTKNFSMDFCVSNCVRDYVPLALWYGEKPNCLPNANRSWGKSPQEDPLEGGNLNTSTPQGDDGFCECDDGARAWSLAILFLNVSAFLGGMAVVGLQIWIAIFWDRERVVCLPQTLRQNLCGTRWRRIQISDCVRAKEQVLAAVVSVMIVACLVVQLDYVRLASRGTKCGGERRGSMHTLTKEDALENTHFMLSWATMTVQMFVVVMYVFLLPTMHWLLRGDFAKAEAEQAAAEKRSIRTQTSAGGCFKRLRSVSETFNSAKLAWDDLFSFERGRYFIFLRLLSEIVETATQASQLVSFAQVRPRDWVVALSVVLVFNGICLPAPLLLGKFLPVCKQEAKLIVAVLDATFDTIYLLLSVLYTDTNAFGDSGTWFVATLSVAIPVGGVALVALDISEAARNSVLSEKWRRNFGSARPRRRSTMMPVHRQPNPDNHHQRLKEIPECINRAAILLSVLISAFCICCGAVFIIMANEGDAKCRAMLGNALWNGATPKWVIVRTGEGWAEWSVPLRGECNFLAIKSIRSQATGHSSSLSSLPAALSQLSQLESLVLTGQHRIASDGVEATILDGVALPMLTELEFGVGSPATRALDLSGCRLRTHFPKYALRFLTALESLELGGCANISCFPPRSEFSRLQNLRHLGLNDTSVTYLPPSVLFAHPLLNVDLYNTPLSRALDWSDHRLGSGMYGQKVGRFDWDRMAATLPLLTSLNISGNGLVDPSSLDLEALRNLESFDVSRNPKLMSEIGSDGGFSWWKVLSEHPRMKERVGFIGLADVGLGPVHVQLELVRNDESLMKFGALTCKQLHWIQRVVAMPQSGTEIVVDGRLRLDLSSNKAFNSFTMWKNADRTRMECACALGDACMYVDYALYYLVVSLAPTFRSFEFDFIFQPSGWHNIFPGFFGDLQYGHCLGNKSVGNKTTHACKCRSNHRCTSDGYHTDWCYIDDMYSCTDAVQGRGGPWSIMACDEKYEKLSVGTVRLSSNRVFVYEDVVKCWRLCKEYNGGVGVTGCEANWKGGCYVHTSMLITHGSGHNGHFCSIVNGTTTTATKGVSLAHFVEALSHRSPLMSSLKLIGSYRYNKGLWRNINVHANKVQSPQLPAHFPRSLKNLYLGGFGMRGTLTDDSISSLQNLEVLDFSSNNLNVGIFQGIIKLTNLKSLRLGTNRISMDGKLPPGIGNLKNLTELTVHENSLHGSLPGSLLSLSKLETLDLATNNLTGPIHVGSWARLKYYRVDGNKLSGQIPENISSLQALETLMIDGNKLSGQIPESLGDLSSLVVLTMGSNKINGAIPSSIGNLKSLETLKLQENELEGEIPSEIGSLLRLNELSLYGNNLNGFVPATLSKLTNLKVLKLHGNNLVGVLPDFTALANLEYLSLGENFRPFPGEIGSLCLKDRGTWAQFTPCV